jgi:hypothetical protein
MTASMNTPASFVQVRTEGSLYPISYREITTATTVREEKGWFSDLINIDETTTTKVKSFGLTIYQTQSLHSTPVSRLKCTIL